MAHVTFIHGIGNKPPADVLLDLWLRSLALGGKSGGLDLKATGITSGMAYWADVLYRRPLAVTADPESLAELEVEGAEPVDLTWLEEGSPAERDWATDLSTRLQAALAVQEMATARRGEGLPIGEADNPLLPWYAKERLLEALLRDAHHYLWNSEHHPRPQDTCRVQNEIRRRTLTALQAGAAQPGPHVVVSHGMGSVIAYDCLKRVEDCPPVDALITLGSPLGLGGVQARLQPDWTRETGFPARLRGAWTNLYDRLDPVAGADPRLAGVFRQAGKPVVRDVETPGAGGWRHDIGRYLTGRFLRGELGALLAV